MHSEEMRQKLNWMTLEKRRVMARLCMMHRSMRLEGVLHGELELEDPIQQ